MAPEMEKDYKAKMVAKVGLPSVRDIRAEKEL